MKPIVSLKDLAWKVGIPLPILKSVANNISDHYRTFAVKSGPSKVRQIRAPRPLLKDIQRRISKNILGPIIGDGGPAHGAIAGRSPDTNAAVHRGQRCVISMDVKDCFNQITHHAVYEMFRREGFGRDVSNLLTKLTTWEALVPQGAPTSTAIANLVLRPVDKLAESLATPGGCRYTRFVDDITLSGNDPRPLISHIVRKLSALRLRVHRYKSGVGSKFTITPRSRPQVVTGLVVNHSRRSFLPSAAKAKLREAIKAARPSQGGAKWLRQVQSLQGSIAHVKRFHPGEGQRLQQRLLLVPGAQEALGQELGMLRKGKLRGSGQRPSLPGPVAVKA